MPILCAAVLLAAHSAPAQLTGTFGKCDPQIHDKLAGAEWRSPSECEVNFDAYVRKGLTAALQPAIDGLAGQGWAVTNSVELQSLTAIPRHTETKPFQLNEQQMHQGGAFFIQLALDKGSPVFAKYDQQQQDAMAKFGAALKAMNAPQMAAAKDAMDEAARAEQDHTACQISIVINRPSIGIATFKGGHSVTRLAQGGFAVTAPYAQAPTGGDVSAAQNVTYVFVGAFTAPASSGPATGDENVDVRGTLNATPAKLLTVQNVAIRIEAGSEMAQQVIKLIDWKAINDLMAGKE